MIIRPLRQISGEAEFNEVFLDGVSLEDWHVLGEVGDGWSVALTTLMHERMAASLDSDDLGVGLSVEVFADAIAAEHSAIEDRHVLQEFGALAVELLAVRARNAQLTAELSAGATPGPGEALSKITTINAATRLAEMIADLIGPESLAENSPWYRTVSMLPALRSAGGTEEILRTMVAERVLGLPQGPRIDKDVPFSAIPTGKAR